MKLRTLSAVIIIFQFCSLFASAAPVIVKIEASGWTESTGTGYGDKVLAEFTAAYPDAAEVKALPSARGIQGIASGKFPCIFSGDEILFERYVGEASVSSKTIVSVTWRFVTALDKSTISNHEQLRGKSLALLNGIILEKAILGIDPSVLASVSHITKKASIIKMVASGRIDVGFVTLMDDGIEQFNSVHFDPNMVVRRVERKLNCSASDPDSQKLIDIFNRFLEQRAH